MKKDGKWYKHTYWDGKYEIKECVNHSYAWSGKMPCTGMYKCVFCGKPEDENTYDGKKKEDI